MRRERGSVVTSCETQPSLRVAVIQRATYRLRFNRDFTFAQAAEVIPYLAAFVRLLVRLDTEPARTLPVAERRQSPDQVRGGSTPCVVPGPGPV